MFSTSRFLGRASLYGQDQMVPMVFIPTEQSAIHFPPHSGPAKLSDTATWRPAYIQGMHVACTCCMEGMDPVWEVPLIPLL